jgi:hypothetical protein
MRGSTDDTVVAEDADVPEDADASNAADAAGVTNDAGVTGVTGVADVSDKVADAASETEESMAKTTLVTAERSLVITD